MNDENELVRPQMKGGLMRDEMGNPPGTIYFLENPIEWFKNIFFGKKQENIIPEPIPETIQEQKFEREVAEKLDRVFNCNHDVCFRLKKESYRMYGFGADEPRELFFRGNFRYARYFDFYEVSIYNSEEPELIKRIYCCELVDCHFVVNNRRHTFIRYKYISGIWDESFLETLNELVDIKVAERKILEEQQIQKQLAEDKLKEQAEQIKQERIRKMFTKEP